MSTPVYPCTNAVSPVTCSPTSPSSYIFYPNYSFLTIGNLQSVFSGDVDYLELQGCFLVPKREILDDLVQQYFLHVHPFLPLLHEGHFWQMYHQPRAANPPALRMSLLVFQALMFSSCNFASPETLQALGFSTARQAKAGFYRRAKLLYDFDTESSPIYIAQAAILLSFRACFATLGVKKTTWLSVAIRHAELADANQYANFESTSVTPEKDESDLQNTLKRLWWCCIIRDRVLSLCIRRGVQIDRARFNFAANTPLRHADLEDEVHSSNVYGIKTKRHLLRVFEKFIELCTVLTDVLAMVYPLDEQCSGGYLFTADTSKIWQAKRFLREWAKDTALHLQDLIAPDTAKSDHVDVQHTLHESVTLYINLMYMFYHSSWLALCHYEALGLTSSSGQSFNSMSDLSSASQQNREELQNAASALTKCFVTLNRSQLDRFLPSSAVTCTATPLLLHVLDVKMLGCTAHSPNLASRALEKHRRLKDLVDVMKTYYPQYDLADPVINAVEHAINSVQFQTPLPVTGTEKEQWFEWADLLRLNPSVYLRLTLAIDLSLSKNRNPEDRDFPPSLRGPIGREPSPIMASLTHDKGVSPVATPQGGNSSLPPNANVSIMEGWLTWGQTLSLTAPNLQDTEDLMEVEIASRGDINSPSDLFDGAAYSTGHETGMTNFEEPSVNQASELDQFVGDVVGTLSDLDPSTFMHDMIRAAL